MSKHLAEHRRAGRVVRRGIAGRRGADLDGESSGNRERDEAVAPSGMSDAAGSLTPRAAIERRVALARLVLVFLCLLGLWLDVAEPRRYAAAVEALLGAYVVYATAVAVIAWRALAPRGSARLMHCADLVVLSAVLAMVDRPLYPLLPLLVYACLSGAIRWQWRGTLATALVLLAVSVAAPVYRAISSAAILDVRQVIARCAALVVVAVLTGRLGALEARTRSQMRQLATPPEIHSSAADGVIGPMLEWAAGMVRAPRVLLAWEDTEEPWLEIAVWDRGRYGRTRERPELLTHAAASEISPFDFLHRPPSPCVVRSPEGFRSWKGEPLDPAFRTRFSIGAVCSVRLTGEQITGRLFFLDKPGMTSDDLVLGGIIAHQLASRLRSVTLTRRLEDTVVLQERLRFARDLHDGAVQSLTGLALELERVLATAGSDATELRGALRRVQLSLRDEQRRLRLLIQALRASGPASSPSEASLESRLGDLVVRVERQWNLTVELRTRRLAQIPAECWGDICLIVHEAVVNASRHGRASQCVVEVQLDGADVKVVITDNGRGFPFKGRYDHQALSTLEAGPSTLRERTTLLRGSMTLDSTEHGASLEIRFPASAIGHPA